MQKKLKKFSFLCCFFRFLHTESTESTKLEEQIFLAGLGIKEDSVGGGRWK